MARLLNHAMAKAAACRLLAARGLPQQALQVDEIPGIYGVRSPVCHIIFARSNGKILYGRFSRKAQQAPPRLVQKQAD